MALFLEEKRYNIKDIESLKNEDKITFMTQHETMLNPDTGIISSGVWVDFRRMMVSEENCLIENYVWCLHCKHPIAYLGSTTTRLKDHQRKCPARPFDEANDKSKATITFKLAELEQIKDAAAKFIVKDIRPFLAIEGEGLRDLIYSGIQLGRKYPKMNEADLRNAIPTRNTVLARVHEMAESGKNLLARKLRNAIITTGKIAATADIWTEPNNSTAFLSLTVHFFTIENAEIKLEAYTADIREMKTASMTGSVIKQAIYEMFGELGITEDEVRAYVCIVTDRGSNMLAAVNELDSEECLAHLISNVVGHMLKHSEVKEILAKAAQLVRYMKTSHAGAEMTSKLKIFPETRFNYAHDMLESIHTNYDQVYEILVEKEQVTGKDDLTDKITCLPKDKLKTICDFLAFFKEATTEIEGDKKITIHKVWPVLRMLRANLQPNRSDCDLIASMRAVGLNYITKPENQQYFEPSLRHKLALFLNPCMNQMSFLSFRGKPYINNEYK